MIDSLKRAGLSAVVLAAIACAAIGTAPTRTTEETAPPVRDSLAAARDSAMRGVLRAITGREQEPAESVFTNIRALRGIPAGRVPRIMNLGFARALGVGCDHCHVAGDWAREDKAQKQIARDMMAMVDTINRRLLPRIAELRGPRPTVNCTTCHRGSITPAIELPSRAGPAHPSGGGSPPSR